MKTTDGHETLLVTVNQAAEADVIESLLTSYGVPTARKYRESGDYTKIYMGLSNFGIDLYVAETDIEKAKEILSYREEENDEVKEPADAITAQDEYMYERKRRMRIWILIAIACIPGLAVLLMFCAGFLMQLMNR